MRENDIFGRKFGIWTELRYLKSAKSVKAFKFGFARVAKVKIKKGNPTTNAMNGLKHLLIQLKDCMMETHLLLARGRVHKHRQPHNNH